MFFCLLGKNCVSLFPPSSFLQTASHGFTPSFSAHDFLNVSDESVPVLFPDNWDMITSPSASALRNSDICAAWESGSSRNSSSASVSKPPLPAAPPSDPLRQAKRLPIKVLKMLTARSGHILHPEYLQPLPSTPVSPIEVRRRFSAASEHHFGDC